MDTGTGFVELRAITDIESVCFAFAPEGAYFATNAERRFCASARRRQGYVGPGGCERQRTSAPDATRAACYESLLAK
jgi:hypothetical protein